MSILSFIKLEIVLSGANSLANENANTRRGVRHPRRAGCGNPSGQGDGPIKGVSDQPRLADAYPETQKLAENSENSGNPELRFLAV